MEVILRDDIEKLGTRGQLINVAAGYARNYLFPKKLAVPATEANKKIIEQERLAHLRRETKEQADAEDLGGMMAGLTITLTEKAGEMDQLFGSVTSKDIAEALAARGYTIDRRKIHLAEPIKQLGEHKIPVRLHREVTIEITLHVVKEE
ncbi:MAG: 50S ribosomal protein L9 [Acidobacteria bacterium]|nr:50S ribosomal protein L9 [Acidobacteriota bacterium]